MPKKEGRNEYKRLDVRPQDSAAVAHGVDRHARRPSGQGSKDIDMSNPDSPIRNVAVVGGSGNLGRHVVLELLNAGFTVTALKRQNSTSTYPAAVVAKEVDYSSIDSLTTALKGQDAVVSALATAAVGGQRPLVDAAVAVGVRRFIPSEFGINTRFLGSQPIATILQGKIQTLNYIHQQHKRNPSFTWTGISTGIFFDWGLDYGSIGLDKVGKTATIYDSGNTPFQTTNLPLVGQAVAAVLTYPERTINRYISIASFNPTQNEILAVVERITGERWTVNHATTAEHGQIGAEKLSRQDYSAFSHFLRQRIYEDGGGLAVQGPDNALDSLGLAEENLEATLEAWLARE
ncbi:NAD(P)-binding protein [Poronia punctata]|nr:NAD(P)-binding protein [Poronia punctata]